MYSHLPLCKVGVKCYPRRCAKHGMAANQLFHLTGSPPSSCQGKARGSFKPARSWVCPTSSQWLRSVSARSLPSSRDPTITSEVLMMGSLPCAGGRWMGFGSREEGGLQTCPETHVSHQLQIRSKRPGKPPVPARQILPSAVCTAAIQAPGHFSRCPLVSPGRRSRLARQTRGSKSPLG